MQEKKQETKKRIAVIRIKGRPGLNVNVKKTLELLRLYKKNTCVVIPNTNTYIGMLDVIKNAVTWGEINEETMKMLLEKRGKLPGKEPLTESYLKTKLDMTLQQFVNDFMNFKKEFDDVPGLKKFFKLNPPKKGFERKGIKVPFSMGGVVGYRKDKINDLIKKMI